MKPSSLDTLLGFTSQELELEVLHRSYERTAIIITDLEFSLNNLRKKQFAREREIVACAERIAKAKKADDIAFEESLP